jgi:hypothetical protein
MLFIGLQDLKFASIGSADGLRPVDPKVRCKSGKIASTGGKDFEFARPTGARRNTDRLRELARWYHDFAERAGSPDIWERRVHTAKDLEAEASRIELIPW